MPTRKVVRRTAAKPRSKPAAGHPAVTPIPPQATVLPQGAVGVGTPGTGGLLVGTPATPGQDTGALPPGGATQPGSDQGPSAAARAAAQGPATGTPTAPAGAPVPAAVTPASPAGAPASQAGVPVPAPHPQGAAPSAHGTPAAPAAAHKASHGKTTGLQTTAKLRKPKGNQSELAAGMAAEIRRSSAAGTYRVYFGAHAPDPEEFATELEHAGTLSVQEIQERTRWDSVRNERNTAWDTVLTSKVDAFIPFFDLALAHDGNVATEFQTAGVFLRTNKAIGARGAATRKAKKAAAPVGG